jgi:hypothetical protein
VKDHSRIVTRNNLEAVVTDAVNVADKPIMNDDDTTGAAQKSLQKIANVISFSVLSNIHNQRGHAISEAMMRFLEGDILPAGVDAKTRADTKRIISKHTIHDRFGFEPLRPTAAMPSDIKFSESVYIDVFYILRFLLCAMIPGTQWLFLWLAREQ